MEHNIDIIHQASQENNGSYAYNIDSLCSQISLLVSEGHKIKWSANERWCEINGKTFNIAKSVYEAKLGIN